MTATRFLVTLLWLTGIAVGGDARSAEQRPFGSQDFLGLKRISQIAASPDGRQVVYTLRGDDSSANKAYTGLWLQDTVKRGANPLRLTDDRFHDGSAAWSRDGRSIYFLSARSGSTQVWRITNQGADPTQITDLPLDVGSFRLSPTADRIIVSLEVFRDCEDLACTKRRLETTPRAAATGVLYDALFVRHWDAWNDGRRSQLFAIALDARGLATGTARNLTAAIDGDVPGKPFGGSEDYAISPDGARVVFTARVAGAGEAWSTNFDLYSVPAAGGPVTNLTRENPAADGQPAFSPDGKQLAYLATDRPGFESDRAHLVLLDLGTGAKRALTANWDRSIAEFAWSQDGKTLLATTDHLGQHPLWAIDVATGRSAAITGAGKVESFSVAPQKLFFTHSTLSAPPDLYSVGFSGGRTLQLTRVNQAALAGVQLGEYAQFSFPGWHDETVFGYVVKPPGLKPGQRVPIAFVVHGGPQGSMANEWHWRWNAQMLAGAGYGVVMIDFHGSTGYGQAFTDSISGDWGGKPLVDLEAGYAAALAQFPFLDGTRACALGGSYGGFMINWIAGKWPDGFKCLVTHDGVFDNRAMYYSTEELWFPEWEMGGPEYANPEGYARFNPVDYVKDWRTPTLVIQGQLDYRVPLEQGLGVFTALQRRGIPSQLLYFPDENHWVLQPANRVEWYDTVIAWMNRWTQSP
jgi:dipeptidyl aminopeptidase/acylaminoacyl peptidase